MLHIVVAVTLIVVVVAVVEAALRLL